MARVIYLWALILLMLGALVVLLWTAGKFLVAMILSEPGEWPWTETRHFAIATLCSLILNEIARRGTDDHASD